MTPEDNYSNFPEGDNRLYITPEYTHTIYLTSCAVSMDIYLHTATVFWFSQTLKDLLQCFVREVS